MADTLHLVSAADPIPDELDTMLEFLGDGEAGFGGTPYGTGEMSLRDYVELCRGMPTDSTPGRVPQTVYWMVVEGRTIGMVKMRHQLNDALRVIGGHIGYYVASPYRRNGYAERALALALEKLHILGVDTVMLTTDPDNVGSIKVIEKNGGRLTAQVPNPDSGGTVNQYWITRPPAD